MQGEEPSARQMDDVRRKAEEIAERVRSDPAFVAQLVQDPRGTLEGAGLPGNAVNSVIGAEAIESGEAQARCWFSIGCVTTRCCFSVSVCCGTGSC